MAEYISQITLPNNSTYNLKDSAALPLAGGNMTGTINRYYSSTSTSPILMLTANNKDADLWKVGHGTAVGSVSGNCYILRYKGTNSSPNNYLQLLAGTSASPSTVVFQVDENGNITFPQINKGDTTTPIYFNNGVVTEGTTIGASAYHDDSYFAMAEHGNHVPAVQTANNITFLRNDNSWHKLTSADVSTLINLLSTGDSQLTANDYVITQYVGGGTTTTTYHRRKASNVVNATLVKAALGTVTTTAKKFLKDTGSWVQVDWGDLTGKPSTFSPSAHDHNRLSGLGRKTAVDTIAYNPSVDNGCRLSWLIYDSSSRNNDATNSPSFDASVLNLPWDQGGFNGQIAISSTAASNTRMQIRSSSSVDNGENANPRYTTNYGAWREVVTATKATKVGDTNKPVYIDATGQATAISYTIGKSVPSNAVFTDHYAWEDITSKPTTLSGYGITDAKIASDVITLGSSTITPVTSVNGHSGASVSVTASDLGLASALKYVGKQPALPKETDSATYSTYNNGDVITVSNKEYAYVKGSNAAGSSWVELGDEGSYKLKQTAFTNSTGTADGSNTSTTFIYSFSQTADGAITDIKTRKLPTYNNYSHPTGDGNLHVPATGTTNGGKFLKAGDTAGSLSWATLSKADISDFGSYLPLSGGTLTGALTTANNTWNSIGDDAYLGDINKAGHIGIQGKNGNTGIFFTTYNQSTKSTGGAITWNGTNFSITSTTAVDASISGNAATATTATNISYTSASDNVEYPILIKNSTGSTTTAGGAKFNSDVTINPSTSAITATLFKGTLNTNHINQVALVGTREMAGGDKGSRANPRYLPEKWKFNANITVTDGDIITIKTPGAGHDYGTYLSLDNGVNYYPIVLNTNGRYTTHFSAGTAITLRFDSSGSAASMFALSGQNNTTRVTVSGGVWRLLTVYDSGNTNDTSVMYIRIGSAAYKTTTKYQRYVLSLIKNETHIIPLNIDKDGSNHNGTTTNNHVLTTDVFDITSYIFVYNTNNASYAADATVGAGGLWYGHAAVDMRYSFNITTSTFTAHKNVYIKASLQSATTAKLCTEGNPVTQTLPSTKDNYIYILIGRAYNGYCITLFDQHPIYYYDGTTIREFSPINAIGTAKGDLMYWSAANLPVRLALGTTGHFLKATDDGPAWSTLPTASTNAAGIIQIGTGSSNAMAGNTVVNKVKTTAKTDNVNYKLLMSAAGASPTSGSNYEAVYDANITVNPSTHTITATTFSGALSGNASTATTLQTERKIWGRSFDGSADVTGDLDWDSQTYRQRIHITDDSTANTEVFTFSQSTDSGVNYTDLFTIYDNKDIRAHRTVYSEVSVWGGSYTKNTAQNKEHDVGARGGAGQIYLWSAAATTGDRGIWLKNADETTSSTLFTVNQSNQIKALATIACQVNISYANTAVSTPMLKLTDSAAASVAKSGTWMWGLDHVVTNLAVGGHTCIITGAANATNKAAVLEFNYNNNTTVTNNTVGLGLYSNNNLLTIDGNGQVTITKTTDATSTTNGVLKVDGGISVAKAIYMGGQLTIDNSAAGAICMTRTSAPNWIWANNAAASIAFCINNTLSEGSASLKIEKTAITGYNNNYADLGTASVQWKSVHSYKYIVEEKVTLQWNATDQSLDFVFA